MLTRTASRIFVVVLAILVIGLPGIRWGTAGVLADVESGLAPSLLASAPRPGFTYQWHTFYGVADGLAEFRGVATDAAGNVYVAGYAQATWGSPLHPHSGGRDIVVVKLNTLGIYQWHTFYGATPIDSADGDDEGAGIAVDAAGNLYVTGYSDKTWQGAGNKKPITDHGNDAEYMFILKLNTHGAYQWHTFYQPGRANAIALDNSGHLVVTGYAASQSGEPLHSTLGPAHLVVMQFDIHGSYRWHTYYGAGPGAGEEGGYGIATDPSGNIYVTGAATYQWQGNGGVDPLIPISGGIGGDGWSTDIVVLKLNSSGTYQWHTFAGASVSDDAGNGIVWSDNGVTIVGQSYYTWGSPRHARSGERDIAVLRLSSQGHRQWNTFYGSYADDTGGGITADANGNTYIVGWSMASWLGEGGASPRHPYSGTGGADIVVLKLDNSGAYRRHTFYGAADVHDYGIGIALDDENGVFVTGFSASSWHGDGGRSPLRPHSGNAQGGDGYVLKLSDRIYNAYLPSTMRGQ
jgi:hypothetical protein